MCRGAGRLDDLMQFEVPAATADAPAPGKRPAAAAVNVSGRLINPAALRWYPALSPDDVAAMSYALGDLAADGTVRRNQRRAAREALERVGERDRRNRWCLPSGRTVCVGASVSTRAECAWRLHGHAKPSVLVCACHPGATRQGYLRCFLQL